MTICPVNEIGMIIVQNNTKSHMKREFISAGGMPERLSKSMEFESIFRAIASKILENFSVIIEKSFPNLKYPIANYSTGDEWGYQIALESDIFTTDLVILRRHFSGYSIIATSEGDCDGVFEFEFPEEDSLTKLINPNIVNELNKALGD